MHPRTLTNKPVIYEIIVVGCLEPGRAVWFAGLELINQPDGTTRMTGPVIDQAALHGIFHRIRDLGLPLVSVRQISRETD